MAFCTTLYKHNKNASLESEKFYRTIILCYIAPAVLLLLVLLNHNEACLAHFRFKSSWIIHPTPLRLLFIICNISFVVLNT